MVLAVGSLLAAGAAAAAPAGVVDPIAAFRAICMDGVGRFAKGAMTPVTSSELSTQVRGALKPSPTARLYRATDGRASMTFSVEPESAVGGQSCRLFANDLHQLRLRELGFTVASDRRMKRFNTVYEARWTIISELGYQVGAWPVGARAMVLESIIFDAATTARYVAEVEALRSKATARNAQSAPSRLNPKDEE